jgi:hypothetical protein
VQELLDALYKTETVIYNRGFNARQDAEQIISQVSALAKATLENLQALQNILMKYRRADEENGYSPNQEPIGASRNQDVHYTLLKHTNAFQRVADFVDGREDWSKLAPSPIPPRIPSRSPSAEQPMHLQIGGPSGSGVTVSPPRSPYQPTVEEFEGSSDEEIQAEVESYHYCPPGEPHEQSPKRKPDENELSKEQFPPAPPQVIVRTATDPDFLANMVDSPRQRADYLSSPLHNSTSADYEGSTEDSHTNEGSREGSPPHPHPADLPRLMTRVDRREKTEEELEEEMRKLQAEMEAIRVGRSATQSGDVRRKKSRRRHHHSVDLRAADDYPHREEPPRRPRASTTLESERPRSYYDGSSSDNRRQTVTRSPRDPPAGEPLRRTPSGRARLSPGHSPRSSRSPRIPQSATDPQVDRHGRTDPVDARQAYGIDPRTSLPTVLGSSSRNTRPRRDTRTSSDTRTYRLSQNYDNPEEVFRDFVRGSGGGGDFELFGPSPIETPRPRAGSRAQSTSPANQVSPSPRSQNIDPVQNSRGVEPTVKNLPVTLEDLFHGTTKKVKIRRQRYNTQIGRFLEEERILDVPIYKGLKPGSKVKFQSEGDETLDGVKELHFILIEVNLSSTSILLLRHANRH